MSASHDDFEVLCALAASGDLTKTEHAALREHLKNCIACQSCLVEMRRLAIPLLFAQRFKTPGKQLRKDLQERFTERAIREGIPLSARSRGAGFSALGIVTVVFVVLLLVTATLQQSPTRRLVVDTDVPESAQVSTPQHNSNRIASLPAPTARRMRRDRRSSSTVSLVAKRKVPAIELAALPGHQFTFTLASRNPGMRAYPSSTPIGLPDVVPSLTFAHHAPGLFLDTTSEVFRHNAPRLPAESEHDASAPIQFRSNLASQSLDLVTYRNTLKANFRTNGFELIHSVVPETTSQERSQ
jgi:anti-sigma factor RsiW